MAGKMKRARLAGLFALAALTVCGMSRLAPPDAPVAVPDAPRAAAMEEAQTESAIPDKAGAAQAESPVTDAPQAESPADGMRTESAVTGDMQGESVVTDAPEAADADALSKAETLLQSMGVREKVFQLFMVFPEQLAGKAPVTAAGGAMREGLARYPVGGVIFDRDSMKSREQVRALLDDMQGMSRISLLMACDEEGGRVNRLMGAVGTPYVGPMLSYRDGGAETAKANALKIAGGLVSCGFNMDLAPVADVWSNPENKVIGNRAYSTDFTEAATLVSAAVTGFHEGGVACTLKHFPGHGNTYEDSHNGLAKVYRTRAQLEAWELKPFRAGIEAGADAVMVGHLVAGEIDSEPATMSRVIVTEMLRGELGFMGAVMTDSLQMDAISKNYTPGEAALFALEAGVDILLAPDDLGWAAEAVFYALESGRLSESRIDESVLRILRLKEAYGLL